MPRRAPKPAALLRPKTAPHEIDLPVGLLVGCGAAHQLWLAQNASEIVAERWLDALERTIWFLRDNSEIGRLRRDLKHPGIRSWLVSGFHRWTIFYGVRNEAIVFYRIEGGERNLRGLLIG